MSRELKTVVRDGSIYGIAAVISRLAGILFIPVYLRVLSVEEYAFYTVMVAITEIGALMLGLGMSGALGRLYFDKVDNHEHRKDVVSTIFLGLGAISALCIAVAAAVSGELSGFVFVPDAPPETLGLAVGCVATVVCHEMVVAYHVVRKQPFVVLAIALSKTATLIGFNILFVVMNDGGVIGILHAMIVSFIVTAGPFVVLLFVRNGIRFRPKIAIDALAFGLPLVPSAAANSGMKVVERQLLAGQSALAVALFGLADRIASLLTMLIATPFSRIFLVRRFESLAYAEEQQELSRVFGVFIAFLSAAAAGLIVIAPELLLIIAPAEYQPAVAVLPFLALSYVLASVTLNIELGLVYNKRTGLIALVGVASLFVSVGINLMLIPLFGAIGAGITAVVVGVVRLLSTVILNARFGVASMQPPWFGSVAAMAMAFAIGILLVGDGLTASDWSHRALRLSIWGVFAAALVYSPIIDRKSKEDVLGLFRLGSKP